MNNENYLDINFPMEFNNCFDNETLFSTSISSAKMKKEIRNQNWQNPRYKYNLIYPYYHKDIYIKLKTFFLICGGCKKAFNFQDKTDNHISKQNIGVGDGKNNQFQIYKSYHLEGCNYIFKRNIYKVKNTQIFINDKLVNNADYHIEYGTIIFNNDKIPKLNNVISIETDFYVIVRFLQDNLHTMIKDYNFIQISNLSLIETSI